MESIDTRMRGIGFVALFLILFSAMALAQTTLMSLSSSDKNNSESVEYEEIDFEAWDRIENSRQDFAPPRVLKFDVQPRQTDGLVTISWTLSDNAALKRFEVWRFRENDESFSDSEIEIIEIVAIDSSESVSLTFDAPPAGIWWYGIHAIDWDGNLGIEPEPIEITSSPAGEIASLSTLSNMQEIYWNDYNANDSQIGKEQTEVTYEIKSQGWTSLVIYNSKGQKVRALHEGTQQPGQYTILWDGRNDEGQPLPNGNYFYKLMTQTGYEAQRLVLAK